MRLDKYPMGIRWILIFPRFKKFNLRKMWRNISELLFHGIKILRMDLINIPWETTFSHVILIPPCFKIKFQTNMQNYQLISLILWSSMKIRKSWLLIWLGSFQEWRRKICKPLELKNEIGICLYFFNSLLTLLEMANNYGNSIIL